MATDYDTVGAFYSSLGESLRAFVAQYGETDAFDGDPALQLSPAEVNLAGAQPVRCLKTALAAFSAIVTQGEGAPRDSQGSHYQKFLGIRAELRALTASNPAFTPAFPAATNPVLRRPPRPEGRVWIENPEAFATVDLANASYGLMLRLLAYAYALRGPSAEKSLVVDLAIGLMQAVAPLAQRAARLPAGPSNPQCNAGVSFTALRDSAALSPGPAARRLFIERFAQLAEVARGAARRAATRAHSRLPIALAALAGRAAKGFDLSSAAPAAAVAGVAPAPPRGAATGASAAGAAARASSAGSRPSGARSSTLSSKAKLCIHSRFCVTGAPRVFLANVKGPWIHPDAMPVEALVEVAHACPSGAIRYTRLDGAPDETAPPVNLVGVREAGPYAFRAQLQINGAPAGFRATLCRCGASKNKPFCDSSHHEVGLRRQR